MEFDDSVSTAQAQAAGLGGGNTSSGFSDNSDPSLGDDDYTVTNTPTEFRTAQNYTQARGASSTNPFPESFFSQLFGADNVNYTNILGSDRINEINNLRYNQATGGMSNRTGGNTGKPYQMGDYYVGQPTQMGTVREVPQTGIMSIMDNLPYIGTISSMMGRNRGLPENDPRRIAMMEEQDKSANESNFVSGILNTGKNVLDDISTGAKDYFSGIFSSPPPSPVASPVENVKIENLSNFSDRRGQFGVPDTRTFDEFGNVLEGASKFQRNRSEPEGYNTVINPATGLKELRRNRSQIQQVADLSQTFKNMGNEMNQFIGADGKKIGEGNLRIAPNVKDNNLQLQYKLPISKYLDRAFG